MKKLILIFLVTTYILNDTICQTAIEAQLGGANFYGLSINSRFGISLGKTNEHRISPAFGVGLLAPWFERSTAIIHTGLNYNYRSWGIGTEISIFADTPFGTTNSISDFADMIVYPNLNYTFPTKSNWYFRISGGAYFAFSKFNDPLSDDIRLSFDGDVIPGAGVGIGYRLLDRNHYSN